MSKPSRHTGRRHPLMGVLLLVVGLFATGGAYAATSAGIAHAETTPLAAEALVNEGKAFHGELRKLPWNEW